MIVQPEGQLAAVHDERGGFRAKAQLKFYFLAVAALLSGLVGLSRTYTGVHYPTDVLAG